MADHIQGDSNSLNNQTKNGFLGRRFRLLILVLLIFGAGFALGEGDISLNRGINQLDKLDYSSVNTLYEALKKDYDGKLNSQQLLEGAKEGLIDATGDPYTEYFDPKEAKEFNEQLAGSFTGIGAELGTNEEKNIIIVSPLNGYPAQKAGLRPQDIIVAINDETTSGLSISEAVRKIRGPADTKVTLTILRGTSEPFDVTIVRTKITVPSVENKIEGEIGYLKIGQFSTDTPNLAKAAAREFKEKGVKAVVLDLRGNPGGYLDSAVSLSSLWLDKGKVVVQQKRGSTLLSKELSSGNNILKGIPTVVLINRGSASASEITAGALKDHNVATLLGVKSFGKGSVQNVEKLPGGAELKVTIARWFTPSGKNIDKHGIEPDVKVDNNDADIAAGKDSQKDRAYELLREKLR